MPVGAPADATKGDADPARPTGGEAGGLQSKMHVSLDQCRSLPESHLPKAAAHMGQHVFVLTASAGWAPMIITARTGA